LTTLPIDNQKGGQIYQARADYCHAADQKTSPATPARSIPGLRIVWIKRLKSMNQLFDMQDFMVAEL